MTIPKRRKTHRGHRGGKKHGNPGFPPKGPAVPPPALAALLGGGGSPGVGAPAPQNPGIPGAPPSGPDPSLAPLLAALAKHAATQGTAQPSM